MDIMPDRDHVPGRRVMPPPGRVFVANREAGAGDIDDRQVRINIRALANVKAVRQEKRNGRDVIIVPSATLPDNVVMNDILYPPEEIEKAFKGLERTPAPLGHPTINGKFVSARDPEGINIGWIGAWNENVRREKGRVLLDKVIDVERASQSEGGKAVLSAIEKGEPVHTSTGLLCNLEAVTGDMPYKFIARNMEFDHDAILLSEDGAATPEQGVGMMVNAAGQEIDVINSTLTEEAERGVDWAVEYLAQALERRQRAGWLERIKQTLIEAFTGTEREPSLNHQENDMSKEALDALSAEVKTLSDSLKPDALAAALATAVGNAVTTAIKPLTDSYEALQNAQKAKDDAELKDLREKIVKANLLDEEGAAELTLNAARKLAEKVKPGSAAALNSGGFKPAGTDHTEGFKAPEAED